MLTTDDKEEIKRLVGEVMAELRPSSSAEHKYAGDAEQSNAFGHFVAQVLDLMVNEGYTKLEFLNPATGEKRVISSSRGFEPVVEVTARAIEVFGTREKALRWLRTPVRSLGDRTPMSLLSSSEGIARVQDVLGRVEHGVW